jgi:hypothetical protein
MVAEGLDDEFVASIVQDATLVHYTGRKVFSINAGRVIWSFFFPDEMPLVRTKGIPSGC